MVSLEQPEIKWDIRMLYCIALKYTCNHVVLQTKQILFLIQHHLEILGI